MCFRGMLKPCSWEKTMEMSKTLRTKSDVITSHDNTLLRGCLNEEDRPCNHLGRVFEENGCLHGYCALIRGTKRARVTKEAQALCRAPGGRMFGSHKK